MIKKVNDENFDEVIDEVNGPYYIKFGSKTCGPCNTMKPVLNKFVELNSEFELIEVDTDESPLTATKFEIRSVPTIHLCLGREIKYSFHGITPLSDLTYAIRNIDDPHFLEHGEFQVKKKGNDQAFNLVVVTLVLLFIFLIFFLN